MKNWTLNIQGGEVPHGPCVGREFFCSKISTTSHRHVRQAQFFDVTKKVQHAWESQLVIVAINANSLTTFQSSFEGKNDAEVEAPRLWPPDAKNWLVRKDPDAGKDWRWEEKGMTEDEMVGWHHWLDGHEFEQVPGVGDGQGSLACCSPWCHKEPDMTEWLNWTDTYFEYFYIFK